METWCPAVQCNSKASDKDHGPKVWPIRRVARVATLTRLADGVVESCQVLPPDVPDLLPGAYAEALAQGYALKVTSETVH